MHWTWIVVSAGFSVLFWQFLEATVSRETLTKIRRVAAQLFWWMIAIFVVGGVIGLLNFGWKHL
jgi:hypothetical protein